MHSFIASYGNREYCSICGEHRQTEHFPSIGDSVRVIRGISDTEKQLAKHPERIYIVERYTEPHGYAVIRDGEYGNWWVHPEALEVFSAY